MDTDVSGTLSRDTSTNIPSHYQTPLLGGPSKSMDSSTMYAPQQAVQHTLPKSQADNQRATHLVWHICHLCNVLLSQLSAFLSLETLYRHETTNGAILPLQHGPLVGAQATMMIDGCKNLDKAVEELLYTSAHLDFLQQPPYRCLLETARGLSYATDLVKTELMDVETIQNCRVACDALMELCYGDESKNIAGWQGVWNDVAMYKER